MPLAPTNPQLPIYQSREDAVEAFMLQAEAVLSIRAGMSDFERSGPFLVCCREVSARTIHGAQIGGAVVIDIDGLRIDAFLAGVTQTERDSFVAGYAVPLSERNVRAITAIFEAMDGGPKNAADH